MLSASDIVSRARIPWRHRRRPCRRRHHRPHPCLDPGPMRQRHHRLRTRVQAWRGRRLRHRRPQAVHRPYTWPLDASAAAAYASAATTGRSHDGGRTESAAADAAQEQTAGCDAAGQAVENAANIARRGDDLVFLVVGLGALALFIFQRPPEAPPTTASSAPTPPPPVKAPPPRTPPPAPVEGSAHTTSGERICPGRWRCCASGSSGDARDAIRRDASHWCNCRVQCLESGESAEEASGIATEKAGRRTACRKRHRACGAEGVTTETRSGRTPAECRTRQSGCAPLRSGAHRSPDDRPRPRDQRGGPRCVPAHGEGPAPAGRSDDAIASATALRTKFPTSGRPPRDRCCLVSGSSAAVERIAWRSRVGSSRTSGEVSLDSPVGTACTRRESAARDTRARQGRWIRRSGACRHSSSPIERSLRICAALPEAELALWQVGEEYENRKRYSSRGQAFADLGTHFPETRYDTWWRAAELYDKRLKDRAAAKAAYAKVPSSSRNFKDAQRAGQDNKRASPNVQGSKSHKGRSVRAARLFDCSTLSKYI